MTTYDPSTQLRGKAAIVGAVDIVSPTGEIEAEAAKLQTQAVREALDDAGLKLSDVDGVFGGMGLAEYLRIIPRYIDSTNAGAATYLVQLQHAAAAVAAGVCDVAVSVHVQTPRRGGGGGGRRGGFAMGAGPSAEWESPYGLVDRVGPYALAASRHMSQFGTKPEHLAQVAVSTRQWAAMNPRAHSQGAITIDDVLASEWVAQPIHALESSVVSDGAGCVVVTRADRATDLAKPPVYVLGASTRNTHSLISQMPDLAETPGAVSAAKALQAARVSGRDLNVVQADDTVSLGPILAAEHLGLCAKGEGGPFVADGKTGPGGSLPMNTNGGGLAYCHPGTSSMFLLVEAVRQLRGECGPRQVEGAQVAAAHVDGVTGAAATVVLASGSAV